MTCLFLDLDSNISFADGRATLNAEAENYEILLSNKNKTEYKPHFY